MLRDNMLAYAEIDEILNLLEDKYKEIVPEKVRNFFKEEKMPNYTPKLDIGKPLLEQNLKRETLVLLAILNLNYWCRNEEEKKFYLNELAKNEEEKNKLNEQYNIDDLFNKKDNNILDKQIIECQQQNEKEIIKQIIHMNNSEIDSWIADRVALLESTAIEDREEITTFSYTIRRAKGERENTEVQGFIPSKTQIKKMLYDVASFRMDDISFYKSVIEDIKAVKQENIIRDGEVNNNYIMDIVQCTIINYLGLYSNESRRNALYNSKANIDDEPLSISDFKKNGTAMCVEKSAMAQNILAFLGYNPMMIFGYISRKNGTINEGHAYNCIIRNGKAILIDFTNPIMKDNEYYKPAKFAINKEKLEDFKKGKAQIEVIHKDLHTKGDSIEEEQIQLVYSSETIDEQYFNKEKALMENSKSEPKTIDRKSCLKLDNILDTILQREIRYDEAQQQIIDTSEIIEIKRLMFRLKAGSQLTEKERALIAEHIKQTNEEQVRFRNKNKSKGLSL